MLRLEPMGTYALPAVAVGFEVADDVAARAAALGDADPALLLIDQQAGGLCMSYPTVVGAMLPLAANVEHGEAGAADLIRGLRAMAEDPDQALLEREFPALHSVVFTHGDPYQPEELRRLHARVARGFRLPPFESGIEAFIRCAPADPLGYLRDWRVFDGGRRFDDRLLQALIALGERIGAAGAPRMFLLWSNSD
jgi:hypothetical protein